MFEFPGTSPAIAAPMEALGSVGLSALPSLPLSQPATSDVSSNSGSSGSNLDVLHSINQAIGSTLQGALNSALGKSPDGSSTGFPVNRIIAVLVGLILIAAGVFGFKETQAVIKTAAKAAVV